MQMIHRSVSSVLFVFVAILSALVGCSERMPESSSDAVTESSRTIPDQILYDSDIMLSDKGLKEVLIHSAYLEKHLSIDSTIMSEIEATFFDTLGHVSSTLVSDSGIVREKTNNLHVWGNVVVVSNNGVKLEADSLFWDHDRNLVTTESFVTITHGKNVQTGYGLESDSRLTKFHIKRQVKGRFENIEGIENKQNGS